MNEDPKDAMIRNLENEIQRLRKQVEEGFVVVVFFIGEENITRNSRFD